MVVFAFEFEEIIGVAIMLLGEKTSSYVVEEDFCPRFGCNVVGDFKYFGANMMNGFGNMWFFSCVHNEVTLLVVSQLEGELDCL